MPVSFSGYSPSQYLCSMDNALYQIFVFYSASFENIVVFQVEFAKYQCQGKPTNTNSII